MCRLYPTECGCLKGSANEERFIRRSKHLAFTVSNIDTAMNALDAHGIRFEMNEVISTTRLRKDVTQLFLYDPDGNGIELGNFDVQSNYSDN